MQLAPVEGDGDLAAAGGGVDSIETGISPRSSVGGASALEAAANGDEPRSRVHTYTREKLTAIGMPAAQDTVPAAAPTFTQPQMATRLASKMGSLASQFHVEEPRESELGAALAQPPCETAELNRVAPLGRSGWL